MGVSSRGIYQFMPSVGVYSIGVWEVLICVCIFLKGVYIAVEGRRRRADQRLQPSGGLFSLFTVREVQNVSRRYFAECAERRERESRQLMVSWVTITLFFMNHKRFQRNWSI